MSQGDLFSEADNECKTSDFEHILNIVQDESGDAFYNIPGAIQNPWPIDNSQCCKGRPGTLDKSETQFIFNFVKTLGVTKENAADYIGTSIPYQHNSTDYEVFLLRNLPKTGIGLRYGEHDTYYPDFAIFFKIKDKNAGVVVLVDTKGLRSEMNGAGFSHYKFLSNTLSIAEINSQMGADFKDWRYRGCFVSTSKIEALSFPSIVTNNSEYKTVERYKRFGIFFETNDYSSLVSETLSTELNAVEKAASLLFVAQQEPINSDDESHFPAGYIGLLYRSLLFFDLPDEAAIKIVYEIVFEHDSFSEAEVYIRENLINILYSKAGVRQLDVEKIQTNNWLGFGKRSYEPLIKCLMGARANQNMAKPNTGDVYFGEAHEQLES
jgi:hypothetical protein